MKIVFDMDNTLTDDFGNRLRPGIEPLLKGLKKSGHTLVLWTNSERRRAKQILSHHDLTDFFSSFLFREDYDPHRKGLPKDIRTIDADLLVDDDPKQIAFVKSVGKEGFEITPYRGRGMGGQRELQALQTLIKQMSKGGGFGAMLKRVLG
ncbi:MAG: HAD family hydrolase [Magnetococcales bacterium]|nr:HAD family hydrolase [Magnetococcales bacterium]